MFPYRQRDTWPQASLWLSNQDRMSERLIRFRFWPWAAVLAAVMAVSVSCGPDINITPDLSISESSAASDAGYKTVDVSASGRWVLSLYYPDGAEPWAGLTSTEGRGSKDGIILSYEENLSSQSRSLRVILTTGGQDLAVTFTQSGKSSSEDDPGPDQDPASDPRWLELPALEQNEACRFYWHDMTLQGGKKSRNYSFLWDRENLVAHWVAYPLCGYYLGDSGRTNAWDFDPSIPNGLQANLGKGFSGYDRGHQIPSGDRTGSRSMNTATFYYTNMTPQIGQGLNQTIWADLEGAVRGWSSGIDTLYVVTGAMPVTQTDKNITYVEDNSGKDVAVPKYYFKALARRISSTGSYQTIAFKMDQKRYSGNDYAQCALSVNELEEITGFTFFPNIDDQYKNSSELW